MPYPRLLTYPSAYPSICPPIYPSVHPASQDLLNVHGVTLTVEEDPLSVGTSPEQCLDCGTNILADVFLKTLNSTIPTCDSSGSASPSIESVCSFLKYTGKGLPAHYSSKRQGETRHQTSAQGAPPERAMDTAHLRRSPAPYAVTQELFRSQYE